MDASTDGTSNVHQITEQKLPPIPCSPERKKRRCFGNATPGEFPLSEKPSIVLHILTSCNLDPRDLVKLEATCSFFWRPANFGPDYELSLAELASLDMCNKRLSFKTMTVEERQDLKQKCGGSWKLVLRFLLAGELACSRLEKSQVVAGCGNRIVVASKRAVCSFVCKSSGQLGHGTTDDAPHPRLIRAVEGTRIVDTAVDVGRAILVSEIGRVYACGEDSFCETGGLTTPRLVESLKGIFVVQAVIGNFFSAVLSREGRIYTFSWGGDEKLGHRSDVEPRSLLGGALENIPVVQIAAGGCYLLALACESGRMSVYSVRVGCGLGGTLGNGSTANEKQPELMEHFQTLNVEPIAVAAGTLHGAALGRDGRVWTWGWSRYGRLGHENQDYKPVPEVVKAPINVKAVHVAAEVVETFVLDNGDLAT